MRVSRPWPVACVLAAVCLCLCGAARPLSALEPTRFEWQRFDAIGSNPDKARLLSDWVDRYQDSPAVWLEFGYVHYDLGDYIQAARGFEQALRLERAAGQTTSAKTARMLARAHAKQKDYAHAERAWRQALALEPDAPASIHGLGVALFNQERYPEALLQFNLVASRADEWGGAGREFQAFCHYEMKEYARAAESLAGLTRERPNDRYLKWTYAKSLYKAKRYADAQPIFEAIAREDQERAEMAQYYAAACLEGLDQRDEAADLYADVGKGASEWAKFAREAEKSIVGNPYRVYLDFLSGYDNGLVDSGLDENFLDGEDFFFQPYLNVQGRVFRDSTKELWLKFDHYSIHYPKLTFNDYIEDGIGPGLVFKRVGPFKQVELDYRYSYAWLDGNSYRSRHGAEAVATWEEGDLRFRFGVEGRLDTYFQGLDGLDGPSVEGFLDLRYDLPAWEHHLRWKFEAEQRWTDAAFSRRFESTARMRYYTHVWKGLDMYLEGTWKRRDYQESQISVPGFFQPRRVDQDLTLEIRFEYLVNSFFSVNWGATFENQESTVPSQDFSRRQVDAGFSIFF